MKYFLRVLFLFSILFFTIAAFAQNKVVVIPLSSTVTTIINPKGIGNYHVVVGPSGVVELPVPSDSTYVLTDLIGTNHLSVTVHVNNGMKLDLTTLSEKKLNMTTGIACPPSSTLKITNTTETVTTVTVSGYYY